MQNLNKENIESFKNTNRICIIDFNAKWCGPCNMMKPELEQLEKSNSEINIGSVDIDENHQLAGQYQIELIPTLVFIKDSKVVLTSVGMKNHSEISDIISSLR